jgi:hypothetical protein
MEIVNVAGRNGLEITYIDIIFLRFGGIAGYKMHEQHSLGTLHSP